MSLPGPLDIQHFQGDTLEKGMRINQRTQAASGAVTYLPADLTGWSPAVAVRNARTGVAVLGVTATKANQATDPGVILVQATAATTGGWTAGPSLVYDVALVEDATGFTRTVAAGRVFVRTR